MNEKGQQHLAHAVEHPIFVSENQIATTADTVDESNLPFPSLIPHAQGSAFPPLTMELQVPNQATLNSYPISHRGTCLEVETPAN